MLDTLYAGPSAKNELHFLNSWFDGIQCRLGAKVTLDASVTSLVLQVLGKARGDDQMLGESRALYGRSLMALQSSLHHETEWKSSETLCATTLLCIYEVGSDEFH